MTARRSKRRSRTCGAWSPPRLNDRPLPSLAAAYATFNAVDAKVYSALRTGDRAAAAALVNGAGNNAADTINEAGRNIQVQNSSGSAPLMRSFDSTVSSTKTLTIALAIVALLLGAGVAFFIARQLAGGVNALIERLAGLEKAFKNRLVPGLQALAGGDLTVKLVAGTQACFGVLEGRAGACDEPDRALSLRAARVLRGVQHDGRESALADRSGDQHRWVGRRCLAGDVLDL